MKHALIIGTLCLAGLGLAGCSSSTVQPDEYSGFLKDYSRLKQTTSPSGATVMRWIDPNLKLDRYTSVYIEPSQLYPKPQPTARIPQSTCKASPTTTTRRSSASWASRCRWPPALARG